MSTTPTPPLLPTDVSPSQASPDSVPEVLVMGAGSVGLFVGGSLQAAGLKVRFVARPRIRQALAAHGLTLTDLHGRERQLPAGALTVLDSVADALAGGQRAPDVVLLTVKCGATAQAAAELAQALPAGTPVLSLQNGIGQAAVGAAAAPALVWLPGMVPYNIAELGPGRFHRGTGGRLAAQDHPATRALQAAAQASGLGLTLHADLLPIQWGKLLINLNNPVNALSGLPLRAELLTPGYRRIFAALQLEALAVLGAAGIAPAQVAAVAPRWLPRLMQLANWLFTRVAAPMLKVDDKARSSMADDLAQERPTEIDALCGAVVALAAQHGAHAPLNAAMVRLVKAWPQRRRPWPAAELRAALRTADR